MAEKRPSPGRTASAARAQQQRSGAAGRERVATTSRATKTASKPAAKPSPGRSSAARGPSSGSRGSSSSRTRQTAPTRPPLPVRMVRGTWLGIARGVGGTARAVGSGAKDIDPALRRDGLALLLLALGIVIAAREWFGLTGSVAEYVHLGVAGLLGRLGVVVPVALVALAVRLMRRPDLGPATGRITIGSAIITTAVCGLVAISQGLPSFDGPGGWAGMRSAGGLVGWVAANPLSDALSSAVAVALLVLLAFFGLLIVTATPVRAIPERFASLTDRVAGPRLDDDAENPEDESFDGEDDLAVEAVSRQRRGRGLRGRGRRGQDVVEEETDGPVPFERPDLREDPDGSEPAPPRPRVPRGAGARGTRGAAAVGVVDPTDDADTAATQVVAPPPLPPAMTPIAGEPDAVTEPLEARRHRRSRCRRGRSS